MSLYLCDPAKNKTCTKESCYGFGGPCFLTCNEAMSADGNELTDNEIQAIDRFYAMRIKYTQRKMKRKLRAERYEQIMREKQALYEKQKQEQKEAGK